MLRVQEFPFTKGKRPLRGRGRGSESPPLHPLKNPHNPRRHNPLRCSALSHGKLTPLPLSMGPIRRVLRRRTPVRLCLSRSARCAERGALSQNLCFAFPIGIVLSEMLRLKIKSEIRGRLYAVVSLGRSRANSSVPNAQAKHKSFDRPAASAQSADAVLPYPTGVRRLSTRFNGVRGLLGGLRGEIRNLPWPPDKLFFFSAKEVPDMRSISAFSAPI